ncbi:MAG TPA: TlpA disulfide reductase family protein [Allosphingosinicella sp.]|jgi:thiol-disulfide isomerase/thioredoxin
MKTALIGRAGEIIPEKVQLAWATSRSYLPAMRKSLLLGLLLLPACGSEAPEQAAQETKAVDRGTPEAPTGQTPLPPAGTVDRTHAGTPAPATPFQDPDGARTSLAEFAGKPVLLNLWATWCAPCVKELPTLDALQVREGKALQVLTVSQDMEGRAKVEAFLAKGKFQTLEAWLDSEMALMSQLGVTTLPTTILYDARGREVWRVVGDKDWSSAEAAKLLREVSPEAAR